MMGQNGRHSGGDMRREIEAARAAIESTLGVPVLGQAPTPRAQVSITMLSDGQVNLGVTGDEIVTRFLFSKGLSIYETLIQQQLAKPAEAASEGAPDGA